MNVSDLASIFPEASICTAKNGVRIMYGNRSGTIYRNSYTISDLIQNLKVLVDSCYEVRASISKDGIVFEFSNDENELYPITSFVSSDTPIKWEDISFDDMFFANGRNKICSIDEMRDIIEMSLSCDTPGICDKRFYDLAKYLYALLKYIPNAESDEFENTIEVIFSSDDKCDDIKLQKLPKMLLSNVLENCSSIDMEYSCGDGGVYMSLMFMS